MTHSPHPSGGDPQGVALPAEDQERQPPSARSLHGPRSQRLKLRERSCELEEEQVVNSAVDMSAGIHRPERRRAFSPDSASGGRDDLGRPVSTS